MLAAASGETFLDPKIGAGRRAFGMNHLLEPNRGWRVRSLSGQRRIDRIRFPFRPSPDDGEIFLGDPLLLHQQTKPPGRRGIFRYQDEPAGLAIEAVNNRNLSAVLDLERE